MGQYMSKSVIGESGREYVIEKELGKGSQGRVFSIKGGRYAFKLLGKKSSLTAQKLKRRISYIKTRKIHDLPISRPLEQIRGKFLGYIMEIATDMMPLENLLKPTTDNNWWENTGGLKKRLLILEKLSKVLSDLHAKGLIYGDLSPRNIFISSSSNYSEIFLIDVDNITHQSKVGEAVYTPSYTAPEIVKGQSGSDTYTDDFSFTIIAYQLLTLNHPFIGDYVNKGEPELEEEAYGCDIPWINHTKDDINRSSTGLDSSLTISKMMMKEFNNTFEKKLQDKYHRTTTLKWNEVIKRAIGGLIECPNCKSNYFYTKKLMCPFCHNSLEYIGIITIFPLVVNIKRDITHKHNIKLDSSGLGQKLLEKIVQPQKYFSITESDLYLNDSQNELFRIRVDKEYIFIQGVGQRELSIYKNNKIRSGIDISREIKASQDDWLILSDDFSSSYQRVLKVRKMSV